MKQITADYLRQRLETIDNGVLKAGSHAADSGDYCALEFRSVEMGRPFGDTPSDFPDIRPINDGPWSSDLARTNALLPVLAALWDWQEWPEARRQRWAIKVVMDTVRIIIAELSELTLAERNKCRSAVTLEDAVDAAYTVARAAAYAAYAVDAAAYAARAARAARVEYAAYAVDAADAAARAARAVDAARAARAVDAADAADAAYVARVEYAAYAARAVDAARAAAAARAARAVDAAARAARAVAAARAAAYAARAAAYAARAADVARAAAAARAADAAADTILQRACFLWINAVEKE